MKKYLLGIDVGTTGTKSMLFSETGEILGHAYEGYPCVAAHVGWSEQNAEHWWTAVKNTVNQLCKDREIAENVAAISLSLQGGTIVPVDENAYPLRPAIVWNDSRCAEQKAAFLREVGDEGLMYQCTGWALSSGLPALTIRWIRENEPEIFARTKMFLSVPDYISVKMTGIAAIDPSDAGINQLSNIRQGEYEPKLLDFAGISEKMLPRIIPSGTTIGHLTEEAAQALGLTTKTVLVTGAHDQYAVALGAGASNAGDILIGSGTCWVVTAIGDEPDFSAGLSQSVSASAGKWGSLQSLSSGGICLDWLRKQIADEGQLPYDVINREVAARKAAEDGLFFFPFTGKAGENKRFDRGSFVGLDLSHDRFHMAKAIMEGVVFQTLWMMESFATKPSEDGLILAGGASKSPVWAQLLADISGLPVRIPEIADLACVGAAIMAGVGCGVYADAEEGYRRLAVKEKQILPDLEQTKRYAPLFAAYKKYAESLGNLS